MNVARRLTICGLSAALFACGGEAPDEEAFTSEATEEIVAAPFYRYAVYSIEKDFRRCASPRCGGWWVKAVNQRSTSCADGTSADRCYVAETDWRNLGLAASQLDGLREKAARGQAIIVGRVVPRAYRGFGNLGALIPARAWQSATDVAPRGSFYRLRDLGIQCVMAPCFSLQADLLNYPRRYRLSVGASRDQRAAAFDAARDGKLIVAGVIRWDRTIARRRGRTLAATQLYLPVEPVQCVENSDCTRSVYDEPVRAQSDCYCLLCPGPAGVSQVETNRDNWQAMCPAVTQNCPVVRCVAPPPVGCVRNQCRFLPPRQAEPHRQTSDH